MKKLAIILLLLSSPVWAGWKIVGSDNAATTYTDPASIARKGNTATMWTLVDHTDFQRMVEVGYFSRKAQIEYDCAEPRSRGLSVFLHAGKMGAGKVIYEDTSQHDWEPITPDTMNEALRKLACK